MIFQIIKTTDARYTGVVFNKDSMYTIGDTFSYESISFEITKIDLIEPNIYKLVSNNYQVIIKIIDSN